MRLASILRESWRNITSGTTRFWLCAGIVFVIGAGSALAEITVIHSLEAEAEQFSRSGAAILVVTAEGHIDGAICDSYTSIAGVQASGAIIRDKQPLNASLLPSSPIPLYRSTPGFAAVVTQNSESREGVLLGQEAAAALGAKANSKIETRQGSVAVRDVYPYPADGRSPGFSFAAIAPSAEPQLFDQCWVRAWPALEGLSSVIATSVDSSITESGPRIAQLNSSLGATFTGPARFAQRVTIGAVPLALLTSFALGYSTVFRRRLEFASAMHMGVTRHDLLAIVGVESLLWVSVGSLSAFAVVRVWAIALTAAPPGAALNYAALCVAGSALGSGLGVIAGCFVVRERLMLKYFKHRQ